MSNQRLPKGDDFMPNVTTHAIRKMYKREKNTGAYLRLQACWYRKKGHTLRQIGDIIDTPFCTVADWLRRMHKGLEGRYPDKQPGAECKLSHTQLDELRENLIAGPAKCGFESGMWTVPLVIAHVRKKFNIEYKTNGMLFLLHRMGFSWRKPRPRHPNAPTKEEIEELKKAGQLIREYHSRGYAILAEDECSTIVVYSGATGWLLRGAKITASSLLSSKRFYTIGVLGDGVEFHVFADNVNSDAFLDFLEKVHAKFGKVLIFLDNAIYHKSLAVREGLEKFEGDIILEYLLPYAPETNPCEGQWKVQKQHTANRGYESVKEMQESINRMYDTGEIKTAKMHDYLRVVDCA